MSCQLEKQVVEVEQFYESIDNIQGNNSKGDSLVKEKGKRKHPTGTKNLLQDASHTEVVVQGEYKSICANFPQYCVRQARIFCNMFLVIFMNIVSPKSLSIWISFYS